MTLTQPHHRAAVPTPTPMPELPELSELSAPPADFHVDADTMSATVEAHWASLVRLATLLLGDRAGAEEVVQEACERTWRRRPDVNDANHLLAYLRTAVVNGTRSTGRRRTVARRHLALARIDHEPPADHPLLVHQDEQEIRAALVQLPARQRQVLVLRYWSQLSEAEIADTLGISAGTVKSTAHRALANLRTHLKDRP